MNPSSPSPENQPERKSIYRPARETAERSFVHKFTDTPQGTSESGSSNRSRPRNPGGPSGWFLIFFLLATALPLAAITFFVGKALGSEEGYTKARNEYFHEKTGQDTAVLPKEKLPDFLAAMRNLRDGNLEKATAALTALATEFPNVPSLDYAKGLAQIAAGDFQAAGTSLEKSIASGHRTSDSRALLAHIELQKASASSQTFADPTVRARQLLEAAIEADPANPAPHIELAGISRKMGETSLAIQHLENGSVLTFPVDTLLVQEITLDLLRDKEGSLPADQPVHPFVLAVRSAHQGDTLTAARIFSECRIYIPETTFAYLVADPLLKDLGEIPELKDILAAR